MLIINSKYILSALALLPFVLFSQSVTIGAGAEVRVEGINNVSSKDASLTIDGDLIVDDGGQLAAIRDARFFISGNITYAGNAFSRARSVMTFFGPNNQSITNSSGLADLALYDLVIDKDASANLVTLSTTAQRVQLDIFNILDVRQGNLVTNNRLFIESRKRGSDQQIFHARIATLGAGGGITGNIRIEKRLTNTTDGWRQLALPVEATIASLSSANATFLVDGHIPSNQINTYWWDSSPSGTGDYANAWTPASTTDDELKAYSVFLSGTNGVHTVTETFNFLGIQNVGDYPNTLNYTRDPADATGLDDAAVGWNFIPNPWPAYVDVDVLLNSASFTSTYKAIHVWDAVNQNYRAILQSGVTKVDYNTDGTDLDRTSTNIPTFQGFWVKATAASQTANLIESTMRTTDIAGNVPFMKQAPPTIRLNVFDADSLWDQLVVYFDAGASRDFDLSSDGYFLKSQNKNVPSLIGREGNSSASIIARQEDISDSIEVSYSSIKSQGTFSINADLSAAGQVNNVYLKDRKTGKVYKFEDGQSLSFVNTGYSSENRFVLYYSKSENAFEHLITGDAATVIAYVQNEQLVLQSIGVSGPAEVLISDVIGRTLYHNTLQMQLGEIIPIPVNSNALMLIVRVRSNAGVEQFKIN